MDKNGLYATYASAEQGRDIHTLHDCIAIPKEDLLAPDGPSLENLTTFSKLEHDSFPATDLPRSSHVTGDIGIHEIAYGCEDLWIVSTRFSCLCTLAPDYSFVPRWRAPFVTALAAEDRCHLNGLALVDGSPRYVTALGTADIRDGWRAEKTNGGCMIDIPSGEIVTRGMSMPHSPRWHQDQLWVLESGTGNLMHVDRSRLKSEMVVRLPGFTRGLAFAGPVAFVGLSKIRPTSAMDGVPISARRDELKCGVAAVDLERGEVIGLLEFHSAVEEIFDVQLLHGLRFPEVIGFQNDSISHTFVVPPLPDGPRKTNEAVT